MAIVARSVLLTLLGGVAITGLSAKATLSPWADEVDGGSVAAVGPAEIPATEPETGTGVCGGFSDEGRYGNLPIAWSFRLCEAAHDMYEVQLRFRNLSERPVRFQYRVWLESPRRCDADRLNESRLLTGGDKQLRPGQTDEWPYSLGAAPRNEYRGRIWSCVVPGG